MPEDKRPPKKWWENCQEACREHEIADDCDAFCGWLWYHGEEEGTPYKEARESFFEKKEGDEKEDKRPPKEWWENCQEICDKYEISDDCDAFCGWLWYHGEEEGPPYNALREALLEKQDSRSVGDAVEINGYVYYKIPLSKLNLSSEADKVREEIDHLYYSCIEESEEARDNKIESLYDEMERVCGREDITDYEREKCYSHYEDLIDELRGEGYEFKCENEVCHGDEYEKASRELRHRLASILGVSPIDVCSIYVGEHGSEEECLAYIVFSDSCDRVIEDYVYIREDVIAIDEERERREEDLID